MRKVKDIMTTDLITVSPETGIMRAAEVLLGSHINGVPVVDEAGKLIGILCQSDLMVDNGYHTIPVVQGGRLVGVLGKDDILNTLITKFTFE